MIIYVPFTAREETKLRGVLHVGRHLQLLLFPGAGKYTNNMLEGGVTQEDLQTQWSTRADHLIFFHYYSVPYLSHLQTLYPNVSMLVMSSALLNHELKV